MSGLSAQMKRMENTIQNLKMDSDQIKSELKSIQVSNEDAKTEVTEKDVEQNLNDWLENTVRVPDLYDVFLDHGISSLSEAAATLDKDKLKSMGITIRGHQKRLLDAV